MAGIMSVQTSDRIPIHVLPDCAMCRLSRRSPTDMDECPVRFFDEYGDLCIPEECNYYTEDEET